MSDVVGDGDRLELGGRANLGTFLLSDLLELCS